MFIFKHGNLLQEQAEALVNTVNCVGVMGKGIALQFKRAYPENFQAYKRTCDAGELEPGKLFIFDTGSLLKPRYIVNFPTKQHWRSHSKLSDIQAGLATLRTAIEDRHLQSIAIPPLGCGNGGLEWSSVKPLILEALSGLDSVEILVFEPAGAPQPDQMRSSDRIPKMTRARALFIGLLDMYSAPGYRLTRLEVQKLAYFLQESGESLNLQYQKQQFGPYAHNLNHVLQHIDGHFINGYGDGTQNSQMYVLERGRHAAQTLLPQYPDAQERLARVQTLIDGFETPYGMEMLATIHWVVTHNQMAVESCEQAIAEVHAWSDRKRERFQVRHLELAWQHLKSQGWF